MHKQLMLPPGTEEDATTCDVDVLNALLRGDTVLLPARTSRHSPTAGYVRTTYDAAEVDLIAGYCPELDQVYVVPIADVGGQTMLSLRIGPTRNNQRNH